VSAQRITTTRTAGVCSSGTSHDRAIRPGDRVITTVFFPGDEHVRDFGVPPLSRWRSCVECTGRKLEEHARNGLLHTVEGIRTYDLVRHGIVTSEDAAAAADDWRAAMADFVR
jgi:hypothetical protein